MKLGSIYPNRCYMMYSHSGRFPKIFRVYLFSIRWAGYGHAQFAPVIFPCLTITSRRNEWGSPHFPSGNVKSCFFFERLIFCFNCSMNNLFTSPISTYNVSNDQCEYIFLHLGGNGWWWFMIIIPECTLIFIHSHLSSHTHHRPLYQLLPHLHADGKRSKLSLQKLLPRVGFVIFLC